MPSELENSVAPREMVSYWAIRVLVLLLLSWALVMFLVVSMWVVPLSIGRALQSLFRLSPGFRHDPANLAAGISLCLVIYNFAKRGRRGRFSVDRLEKALVSAPRSVCLSGTTL